MIVGVEASNQPLEGVVQVGAHFLAQVALRMLLFDGILGLLLDLALFLVKILIL